jgi:hypothetical protein
MEYFNMAIADMLIKIRIYILNASFGLKTLIYFAFLGMTTLQKPKNTHLGKLSCVFFRTLLLEIL